MDEQGLTREERQQLLRLARLSVEAVASRLPLPEIDRQAFSARLFEPGASFVTLTTRDGDLRGCIGTLEAHQPLVEDVREHAAAAASQDYRFLPVSPDEVANLAIEVSRLTAPVALEYASPEELRRKLRPGIDGVILRTDRQRATFLPQVWEKLPEVDDFLGHLCMKMGAPASLWKTARLQVYTYQVEEFHEEGFV